MNPVFRPGCLLIAVLWAALCWSTLICFIL